MALKLDLLRVPNEIILDDNYLEKRVYKLPNPVIKWLTSSDPYYSNKKKDKKDIETITIPKELELIEEGLFKIFNATKIFPVTGIADGLFEDCNLKSVTLSETLRVIGARVFKGCPLENVVIPKGVRIIGESAFEDCKNLVSIKIPESIQEIGDNAFSGCSSLEKVVVPETVQKIGKNAFKDVLLLEYNGNAEGRPWGAIDSISEEIIKQREEEEKQRVLTFPPA